MDFQIAIDKNIEIDTDDFVSYWNQSSEDLAKARNPVSSIKGCPLESMIFQQGLIVIASLAVSAGDLALDAFKDAIKDRLNQYFKKKMSGKPLIKVDSVRQPGGAYLLVIREE